MKITIDIENESDYRKYRSAIAGVDVETQFKLMKAFSDDYSEIYKFAKENKEYRKGCWDLLMSKKPTENSVSSYYFIDTLVLWATYIRYNQYEALELILPYVAKQTTYKYYFERRIKRIKFCKECKKECMTLITMSLL